MFSRFTPPVPRHMWKVEFIPIIEPFDTEVRLSPEVKNPRLEKLEHKMRSVFRCWCDNDAAATFNFGCLLPFYIIEVTMDKHEGMLEYKAEDGEVYVRRHATTEQKSVSGEVRCVRCGGRGHLARECPSPRTCHNCGLTDHLARDCPQDIFSHQVNNKTTENYVDHSLICCRISPAAATTDLDTRA